MNKLEAFNILLNALVKLEQGSVKIPSITYDGANGYLSFYVKRNKEAYRDWLTLKGQSFYLYPDNDGDFLYAMPAALEEIERISLIPDGPVEEMVTLQIPISKAKELGIA